MKDTTIFISYPFGDDDSVALLSLVRSIATRLRRVSIVDGKSLDLRSDFSGNITSYIKQNADCLVVVLLKTATSHTNVLYEAGVAIGANKEVVPITDSVPVVPAMLRAHDAVVFDRNKLNWQAEFSARLEQKLRHLVQLPSDHQVEEKLSRRYMDEEIRRLKNVSAIRTALDIVRAGDLSQARAVVGKLLERDPSNPDCHYLLGDILYLLGCKEEHPDKREQCFELQLESALKALTIDSDFVLALNVKANAEVRLGRLDDALSTLAQVEKIDPDYSVSTYNAACLYAMIGASEVALRYLKSAISKNEIWRRQAKGDPDFGSLRENAAWIDLVYEFGGTLPRIRSQTNDSSPSC